ncbi:MAG: integrase [Rhodobacteraceae bacterium]|nr:MAG: integrase [Paracoccaceae bacterium]
MSASPDPPAASARNTRKAYAADWAHFTRWCRMQGEAPLPPRPDLIARYLAALAAPPRPLSRATIERRLSGLAWNLAQRGLPLDRGAPEIAATLHEIRRALDRPPARKEAITDAEVRAMAGTLAYDLRGLRDRAILLIGHAAGLRRSEIVGLDLRQAEAADAQGWVEIGATGLLLHLAGGREVSIPREAVKATCPVETLERWLGFAQITAGPVFRRTTRDGKRVMPGRLNDRHVARLVKKTVLASGIRADLAEPERLALFSGQSLRARRR